MESTNPVSTTLPVDRAANRLKPGPKGMVMEPYAREVLQMAREGKSVQAIANWLAEAPRNVLVSRQAVFSWKKARLKKLRKLHEEYAGTGLAGPFQHAGIELARARSAPTPMPSSMRLDQIPNNLATVSSRKQPEALVSVDRFRVNDSEIKRAENPLR